MALASFPEATRLGLGTHVSWGAWWLWGFSGWWQAWFSLARWHKEHTRSMCPPVSAHDQTGGIGSLSRELMGLDLLRDASLCDSRKSLMAGNQLLGIWPPNLAILVRWTVHPAGVFSSSCAEAVCLNGPLMALGSPPIAMDSVWLVSITFWVSVSSSGKMVLVPSTSRTIGRNTGHKRCYVLEQHASWRTQWVRIIAFTLPCFSHMGPSET